MPEYGRMAARLQDIRKAIGRECPTLTTGVAIAFVAAIFGPKFRRPWSVTRRVISDGLPTTRRLVFLPIGRRPFAHMFAIQGRVITSPSTLCLRGIKCLAHVAMFFKSPEGSNCVSGIALHLCNSVAMDRVSRMNSELSRLWHDFRFPLGIERPAPFVCVIQVNDRSESTMQIGFDTVD